MIYYLVIGDIPFPEQKAPIKTKLLYMKKTQPHNKQPKPNTTLSKPKACKKVEV